jgi:chaperonin GroEL (HSP60 family)
LTVVSDCAGFEQVSLLLRGETEQIVAETKRVIDGCLYALKHAVEGGRVVPGGGAVETHLARELETRADGISGREQFAVRAFAESLTTIPKTLATSAGLNAIDSLVELRTRQHEGATRAGLVSGVGVVDDTLAHGVADPLEVKRRAISGAVEAANVLLRVDDIITASAESGHGGGDEHDHDHGPGDVVEASGGYPWTLGH